LLTICLPSISTLFPYTTLFRSTAGQYFTNDQIKEMTRKVSAEVDLVHQQTQNQRYGSSHIGATAKDISNVVTDAASGELSQPQQDRKSGSAGMPRPISYAVFCL